MPRQAAAEAVQAEAEAVVAEAVAAQARPQEVPPFRRRMKGVLTLTM